MTLDGPELPELPGASGLVALVAAELGEDFALEIAARIRRHLDGHHQPLRPPRAQRPFCPAIGATGKRCRARCWWPRGAPEARPFCQLHLASQEALDEPPRASTRYPSGEG